MVFRYGLRFDYCKPSLRCFDKLDKRQQLNGQTDIKQQINNNQLNT